MLEKLFGKATVPVERQPDVSAEDKKKILENADGLTLEGEKALADIETQELAQELAKEEALLAKVGEQAVPNISLERYHELLEKIDTAGLSAVEVAQIEAYEAEQEKQDASSTEQLDPLVLGVKHKVKPVVGGSEQPDAEDLPTSNRPADRGFKEVA